MSYVIGTIYKIYYKLDPTIQYVGSTYLSLIVRWETHIRNFKHYLNGGTEFSIYPYFTELGIDNFEIEKIKDYLVYREDEKDRKHLSAYEQLWINKLKCVNQAIAFNPLRKNVRFISEKGKEWYANLSDEQKKKRQESHKQRVENMTEEQKVEKKEKDKQYSANLSDEKKAEKNIKRRVEN